MKPSQAFGVVVRTVGLLAWVGAFFYLLGAVLAAFATGFPPDIHVWRHYVYVAIILFAVGWFLLRRADQVVAYAYRINSSDVSDV
jgi:ABC-type polysaccharide/polyol phosphate export permease